MSLLVATRWILRAMLSNDLNAMCFLGSFALSLMSLPLFFPSDILVPAALEGQITSENAGRIQARIVVEGANGPTTPEADAMLYDNGVMVVPDILANAGGVVVSYFEWVQDIQRFFWDIDAVKQQMESIIVSSFAEVTAIAEREEVTMREAAMLLAVQRVVEAMQVRGVYP